MKYLILVISFLFISNSYAQVPTKQLSAPKLFFEYSWLYDSNCSNTPDRKIDPLWANEAKTRTSDFIHIWNQSGPILFGKVFEIFEMGFRRKELTATLSVCPKTPSYSNPLVLNVTRYLKSYMGEEPVRSDDSFADLVFHELLHTWIVENVDWPTPLLQKYIGEEPVTRNHLHLMAMQKFIYTKLNREDLLKMIDIQYSHSFSQAYVRAWEIVSKVEGHEAFISEIKKNHYFP